MKSHGLGVRLVAVALVVFAMVGAPSSASAQTQLGGFLGRVFDTDEDWLLFGAEARIGMTGSRFQINPRISYNPGDGYSVLQLDANVLYPFPAAQGTTVRPYMGLGAAVVNYKFDEDSETEIGANIIAGLLLAPASMQRTSFFLHSQYTTISDVGNSYSWAFGILLNLM